MMPTDPDAPRSEPFTASCTMSPNDWTRPPLNMPSSFGSSFCPEKEQIDPARYELIGVGSPLPVTSPANAGTERGHHDTVRRKTGADQVRSAVRERTGAPA